LAVELVRVGDPAIVRGFGSPYGSTTQNAEFRVITLGDPLHLGHRHRFPKLHCGQTELAGPSTFSFAPAIGVEEESVVNKHWLTGVLPVILEAYHNYHLISVKREPSRYHWEVHLNRIVATYHQ
jgi:hypothetical protein